MYQQGTSQGHFHNLQDITAGPVHGKDVLLRQDCVDNLVFIMEQLGILRALLLPWHIYSAWVIVSHKRTLHREDGHPAFDVCAPVHRRPGTPALTLLQN